MQTARVVPALALLTATSLFLASQAPTNGPAKAPLGRVALFPSADSSCCTPTVIDSLPYAITEPGLYVVEQDLTAVPGEDGIAIRSPGVTLDLCGNELIGVPGSHIGISARSSLFVKATVRNGIVRNFGHEGVLLGTVGNRIENFWSIDCGAELSSPGTGIALGTGGIAEQVESVRSAGDGFSFGPNVLARDCIATDSGLYGFDLSEHVVLERCEASGSGRNGFGFGFISFNVVLEDCVAVDNDDWGFDLEHDSIAERCFAEGNGRGGFRARDRTHLSDCIATSSLTGPGFELHPGARLEGGQAFQNQWGVVADGAVVEGCTVRENALGGIDVDAGLTEVRFCVLEANQGHGLVLADYSVALRNTIRGNLGSGIRAEGQWARIEDNHLVENAIGIEVLGPDNLITRNSLAANGVQFVLEPTSSVGPTNTSNGYIQPQSPYLNFDLTFPTLPAPPAD